MGPTVLQSRTGVKRNLCTTNRVWSLCTTNASYRGSAFVLQTDRVGGDRPRRHVTFVLQEGDYHVNVIEKLTRHGATAPRPKIEKPAFGPTIAGGAICQPSRKSLRISARSARQDRDSGATSLHRCKEGARSGLSFNAVLNVKHAKCFVLSGIGFGTARAGGAICLPNRFGAENKRLAR